MKPFLTQIVWNNQIACVWDQITNIESFFSVWIGFHLCNLMIVDLFLCWTNRPTIKHVHYCFSGKPNFIGTSRTTAYFQLKIFIKIKQNDVRELSNYRSNIGKFIIQHYFFHNLFVFVCLRGRTEIMSSTIDLLINITWISGSIPVL